MPAFGIIASTVLATALMIFSYMGQAGADVFNLMILLSGLTAAVPYLFSALALVKWSFKADERTPGANWKFDGAVAIVGMLFSALIIYGSFTDPSTAFSLVILTVVVFLIGLGLYFYMRRRFTQAPTEAPPG